MARNIAEINPAVLRWARERAGYSPADIAKRLKVSVERVLAWESGTAHLTQGRLDVLASTYHRPSVIFYLPEPPEEDGRAPTDFRSQSASQLPPGLILEIRLAGERRELALELMETLGEKWPRFPLGCSRDEDPEDVGRRIREVLAVDRESQERWRSDGTGYKALSAWKDAVEGKLGVLVFQAPRSRLGDSRGFSIYGEPLPVVVLRSNDTPKGRCFTLLHEVAHLGLREGGLCDLHDEGIELFCNQVASAALIPQLELLHAARALQTFSASDADIKKLARIFSVSEHALVLRLVQVKLVDWSYYESRRKRYRLQDEQAARREENVGQGPPPHVSACARNGWAYTQLVLRAYHQKELTAHRAATYLRVTADQLPRISQDALRRVWSKT